jgi:hypothetical protein
VGVEQLFGRDGHAVRDADETDVAAGVRRAQRLLHRLVRADAFEDRVRAVAAGPTAPSPTTTTVLPGPASAAFAAFFSTPEPVTLSRRDLKKSRISARLSISPA